MAKENTLKVLVTGHMGFIGSWVAYQCHLLGHEVYGLDDMSSHGERLYDKADLKSLVNKEIYADVSEPDTWIDWATEVAPDVVIHLAGQAIVPRAFREPFVTYKTNALGTLAVVDTLAQLQTTKVILCVTSDKVYENTGMLHPFSENDALGGKDIYSVSKSSSELICRAYGFSHLSGQKVSLQTVRLGNVVGGGDWSHNRLVPDLIHSVEHGRPFKVRYIDATRPFQHVADVVKGVVTIALAAMRGNITSNQAWNLGPRDNSWASVREVIAVVKEYYPSLAVEVDTERYKEDMNLQVSVEKYAQYFDCPRDLSLESVRRALEWYKAFYQGSNPRDLIRGDLY